jgi:ABC-2 type transport system permease protein
MFKEILFLELRSALRQPMIYIFFFLLALMVFGAISSDNIVIGESIGTVHKNSPHSITMFTLILSMFCLLVAAAFFNNAALRDHTHQFNEILFSTTISKSSYFFGRFVGAWILSTLPLLGIYFGAIVASIIAPAVGWLEPDRIGPIPFSAFVNTYLIFVLPNMLFAGSIIFALATKWKNTIVSFMGALGLIMIYIMSGTLLSDIDNETIGALLDTFGIRTYSISSKYYTPIEKNTLSPSFSGLIMWNRIVWLSTGVVILVLSYLNFSFKTKNSKVKSKDKKAELEAKSSNRSIDFTPSYNTASFWSQFTSFYKINLYSIIKSPTFIILFLFGLIIYFVGLSEGYEYYGLKSFPVTYKMVDRINSTSGIFVIIIMVFFSGEVIWRDRQSHINEVIDATPHASFSSLLGKVLAVFSAVSIIHLLFIALGILYQLLNGYTHLELDVYFLSFLIDNLPNYLVWSMILVFINVLINQRYIGYFVSILIFFLLDLLWLMFDVQSNMVSIGSTPLQSYSTMNGFGDAVTGALWFNLYWVLFASVLLALAALMWTRGTVTLLKERFSIASKLLKTKAGYAFFSLTIAWLICAGFVYYNTQILNPYLTSDQNEQLQVFYEQEYKKYENLPMPKVTAVDYTIDVFPEERIVEIEVKMDLVNASGEKIEAIHFTTDKDWNHEILMENAELTYQDEHDMYRIYTLAEPMLAGQTMQMTVKARYAKDGFENEIGNGSIAHNGTFLNNMQILPSIGYNSRVEMDDNNDRKSNGMATKERMPKLEYPCGEACDINYLTRGTADWVDVNTVISTSESQIAIAPGTLVKEWTENGRNYFNYKIDHASQNFYSFLSAEYEVARRNWNGIDMEVYYDAAHSVNVEMMLDAVQRSLEYYTENFGPYYHKQARIIEFPRYSNFAQAFPGTMPYSESFGFISDMSDEEGNNVVDAVVAHEMAHQWWAHQEVSANMQGGTMLTESFAEYSSLMVMKKGSTPMQMREFLKYNHNRYLSGRSSERDGEVPLYKVENQGHIHYGKGSIILYALQDYVGEDVVNAALREFLDSTKYKGPPYPTSMDFITKLEPRVPDSLQYLIHDWFKEITLYDYRLKEVSCTKNAADKYETTFEIEARKMTADSIGNETAQTPNDWVYIGLFADDDEKELLMEKKVKFDKEKLTFTLTSDELPAKAAIDPRRLLIEKVYSDNIKSVNLDE